MTEFQLQCAVASILRYSGKGIWFHPANGGRRDPREARNLKRAGVVRGVADLIGLVNGRAYALELKSEDGRLSEYQTDFLHRWTAQGGEAAHTKGLAETERVLKEWGII